MLKSAIVCILLYVTFANDCFAQTSTQPFYTLYLIGDAGENSVLHSGYEDTLAYQLKHSTTPAAVVFLGDNIYQNGMLPKNDIGRKRTESILNSQIKLIRDGSDQASIYFVPGNHDWDQGREPGLQHVLLAQQWLDSLNDSKTLMLPRDGCPGPSELNLSDQVTLIILDTQWPLHRYSKPSGESSACESKSFSEMMSNLQNILERNKGKQLIVAGHHPVFTYGNHGGFYDLKQHIFPLTDVKRNLYIPLPVIGSIYIWTRKLFGARQDITHPKYKLMRQSLLAILEQFPGTLYVSGHDHSLQYSERNNVHYIVSGAGVKTSAVKKKGYARFVSDNLGFVKLTYFNNRVEMEFFASDKNKKVVSIYKQVLTKG